ncbi:MAG: hypothetical protein QM484_14300 [Woeseiaceae bacterium]
MVPSIDGIITIIEQNKGWFALTDEFIEIMHKFNLRWWEYYEDEDRLRALNVLMFLDPEECKKITNEESIEEVINEVSGFLESDEEIATLTEEEQNKFTEQFNSSSEEQQQEHLKQMAIMYTGFLCSIFNLIAQMTHKKNMCQLIASAKSGDDEAFKNAIKVDKAVLQLPYFQERLSRANLAGEHIFLNNVGLSIRAPHLSGRLRHRKLWIALSLMDQDGLIETLSNKEILDILMSTGIFDYTDGIDDSYFNKRLKEYKSQHRSRYFRNF